MNLFIRIVLIIASIGWFISSVLYWIETGGMNTDGLRGRRSGFIALFFGIAPYIILPACTLAAANFIGGRSFLPEKFSRNLLYFLAAFVMVNGLWEAGSLIMVFDEGDALDGQKYMGIARTILWPLSMTALALFFAQQFYVDDDRP